MHSDKDLIALADLIGGIVAAGVADRDRDTTLARILRDKQPTTEATRRTR